MNIFNSLKEKVVNSSFFKKRAGFSLAEILVVMSITLLLSLLAISYNRASERQLRIYSDQSVIVGVLNRSKVLTLERFNEPPMEGVSICGVGLRFNGDKEFKIFQDFVTDPVNETCEDDSDYTYSGSREDVESFSLGDQVKFTGSVDGLEVLFIPPHLEVRSNREFPAQIILETIDGDITRRIEVSRVGQITTQNIE